MTRSMFDAAKATEVKAAENEHWRIDKADAPGDGMAFGAGHVIRTGRGSLEPGATYTRLIRKNTAGRGGTLVMSDTPDEIRDCAPIFYEARGRVLVNGLGLGCVLRGLLANEDVEHIDVVEVSRPLINLMGPYFAGDDRVTIHKGDAFEFVWPTGTRWHSVWHDVWDDLCTDNLNERGGNAKPGSYERLHRKYGRRCVWQGSWGWDYLKRFA